MLAIPVIRLDPDRLLRLESTTWTLGGRTSGRWPASDTCTRRTDETRCSGSASRTLRIELIISIWCLQARLASRRSFSSATTYGGIKTSPSSTPSYSAGSRLKFEDDREAYTQAKAHFIHRVLDRAAGGAA